MKNENADRDAALAVIEEAISSANDAGVFCESCVKTIATGLRPAELCSTCQPVLVLWLASIVEREYARMTAEEPGRFTITKVAGETFVKRRW